MENNNNPARAKREKGVWEKIGKAWKILALISVAVIAVLTLVGGQLNKIFEKISGKLTEAATKGN